MPFIAASLVPDGGDLAGLGLGGPADGVARARAGTRITLGGVTEALGPLLAANR